MSAPRAASPNIRSNLESIVSQQPNRHRPLAFSDPFINAELVEDAQDFAVAGGVVINLSNEPLVVADSVPTVIPAWKSTILRKGVIAKARRAAVIDVRDRTNLGGLIFGEWDWFGNRFAKFPRNAPLYISKYDVVGETTADPYVFTNNRSEVANVDRYSVRLNLWWAPAETDCFIHNEHPFLEIHTQIYGTGRIEMFHERNPAAVFRQISMTPGNTHDPFCRVTAQRQWEYPWHRYYSETDAIWLAIELHPI
jgi:hypothetical protein